MIQQKVKFKTYEVSHWYDCGKKDVLLETNKMLLTRRVSEVGTQFIYNHTIIIPPVIFGKNCTFNNAIVGPHVTLGDNVHLENSLITDSILGDYVHIEGAVLRKSIIGNDATIKGLSQSLNIGDNNEIDFTS
jgi:glucose-1-phosphate thymidylyltransferase